MFGHGGAMLLVGAHMQDAAVYFGMKGLDAAVQDFGKPVRSLMSLTAMPDSRSRRAVPPVETNFTPMPASLRANSTTPLLSVTLNMAR